MNNDLERISSEMLEGSITRHVWFARTYLECLILRSTSLCAVTENDLKY